MIRRPEPTDQGYIASTWRESLLLSSRSGVGTINTLIDKMLDEVSVRILVACEPSQPMKILGWMAYSPGSSTAVMHYVYVRERQRNRGVMDTLCQYAWPIEPSKIVYTLRGPSAKWLVGKYPSAVFLDANDYLRS